MPAMDSAEDDMRHPPADYPEDIEPGRYRKMADDPTACRAMAAEILDFAFDEMTDGKEYAGLATLANCWLRLSELAAKARK